MSVLVLSALDVEPQHEPCLSGRFWGVNLISCDRCGPSERKSREMGSESVEQPEYHVLGRWKQ